MTPEMIITGDSHAIAAKAGADALGVNAAFGYLSGGYWHARFVQFHPQHGLWSRRPVVRDKIEELRARAGGGPLLQRDRPVLISAGFHLGRLSPGFAMHGHRVDAEAMAAAPDALFASAAFLAEWLDAARGYHRRLLQRAARICPLLVLAPPPIGTDAVRRRMAEVIVAQMRAAGLRVYDPAPDFDPEGRGLAPEFIDTDGVHGNARYGAALMAKIYERGLLPRSAAAA